MTNPTLFPADVAEMSMSRMAALSPAEKFEIDRNITTAISWLQKALLKSHGALEECYGQQACDQLREAGLEFGTTEIQDGNVRVRVDIAFDVTWDQSQLSAIAKRLAAAGEKVEDYIDVHLSIPESRLDQWPPALRAQFLPARVVSTGKPTYQLEFFEENHE